MILQRAIIDRTSAGYVVDLAQQLEGYRVDGDVERVPFALIQVNVSSPIFARLSLVALGRLLAYDPQIMLMDEPLGALDTQTKILMGNELLRIWTAHRKSVVFVTHDIEESITLSDRILAMSARPGRIKSEYRVDLSRSRDFRTVRRMDVFREISERIWSDIVSDS